jgi:hypothetical protein
VIFEYFLGLVADIVNWLAANVFTWDGPQPRNVWGDIEGMVNNVASIGVWIDWAAIFTAAALAIGVWLACLGIKALRALIAHIPQVGGAG